MAKIQHTQVRKRKIAKHTGRSLRVGDMIHVKSGRRKGVYVVASTHVGKRGIA